MGCYKNKKNGTKIIEQMKKEREHGLKNIEKNLISMFGSFDDKQIKKWLQDSKRISKINGYHSTGSRILSDKRLSKAKIVSLRHELLFLSYILFPHHSLTRYPHKEITKIEYNKTLGVVKNFKKIYYQIFAILLLMDPETVNKFPMKLLDV